MRNPRQSSHPVDGPCDGPDPEHLAALGGAFLKKRPDIKPHRIRYWLTSKPDPAFDAKCADICGLQSCGCCRWRGVRPSLEEFPSAQEIQYSFEIAAAP
jgi:hypothetical protein